MNQPILEELARLSGIDANEIASLYEGEGDSRKLKNDAFDAIQNNWLPKISGKFEKIKNDQYGAGLKKGAQSWENFLRETVGLDGLKGEELQTAFKERWEQKNSNGDGKAPKQLTDEELAKDDRVKKLIETQVAALKSDLQKEQEARTALEKEYSMKALRSTAQNKALEYLEKAKWIAGEGDVRNRRIETIHKLIDYGRLKLPENGEGDPIVLNEQGEPAQDARFNPVTFEAYVLGLNPFDFHKFTPGKGSPSPTNGGGGNAGGSTYIFEDEGAFKKAFASTSDVKEKIKMQQAWFAQNQSK